MRFSIDQTVLEKIVNNLVERPYKEVAQILAEIQKDTRPINESIAPEETKENPE